MTDNSSETIDGKSIDAILHFYEVKMQGLGSYSTIVWSRFNWFLTLELALLGFLFTKSASVPEYSTLKIVTLSSGVLVSLLWIVMGILDYKSLKRHSTAVQKLNDTIVDTLTILPDSLNSRNTKKKKIFEQTKILYGLPVLLVIGWGGGGVFTILTIGKIRT